jgi:hypothetical protein
LLRPQKSFLFPRGATQQKIPGGILRVCFERDIPFLIYLAPFYFQFQSFQVITQLKFIQAKIIYPPPPSETLEVLVNQWFVLELSKLFLGGRDFFHSFKISPARSSSFPTLADENSLKLHLDFK